MSEPQHAWAIPSGAPFLLHLTLWAPIAVVTLLILIDVLGSEGFAVSPDYSSGPATIVAIVFGSVNGIAIALGMLGLWYWQVHGTGSGLRQWKPRQVLTALAAPLLVGALTGLGGYNSAAIVLHQLSAPSPFHESFALLSSSYGGRRGQSRIVLASQASGILNFAVPDRVQDGLSKADEPILVEGTRSWFGIRASRITAATGKQYSI